MKLILELGVDALEIINTIANRGCERKVWHACGHVQPCTQVNPCLTCRARRVNDALQSLPQHPVSYRNNNRNRG